MAAKSRTDDEFARRQEEYEARLAAEGEGGEEGMDKDSPHKKGEEEDISW